VNNQTRQSNCFVNFEENINLSHIHLAVLLFFVWIDLSMFWRKAKKVGYFFVISSLVMRLRYPFWIEKNYEFQINHTQFSLLKVPVFM